MPRPDSAAHSDVARSRVPRPHRLIVGITSIECLGWTVRLVEVLSELGIETHVVTSEDTRVRAGDAIRAVESLATHIYQPANQAARISSGSFLVGGMIIAPCSLSTVAAIAHGVGRDLVHRAADVTIKEARPLVLLVVDDSLSPISRDNLARLEDISGVSVVRPSVESSDRDRGEARERTIHLLLQGVGIERSALR